MPFEFMAKASRMVKIEKEQISGIKLKSTVSLFLPYPVCCEIQYFVLNDDVARRKQWLWRPSEMGISRTDHCSTSVCCILKNSPRKIDLLNLMASNGKFLPHFCHVQFFFSWAELRKSTV